MFSYAIIFIVIVRPYVIHLLGTYVTILCNWLIFWQNAFYLYSGRSMMCLIVLERCYSSLVLKPWRLDKETSEEKLITKAGQVARHLRTDSSTPAWQIAIYWGLMTPDKYYLSRLREFRFLDLIFGPCLCTYVGFLFSQP